MSEDTRTDADMWLEEKLEDYYGMRYRIEDVLYSGKSDFQKIQVVKTRGFGNMLLNDGLVMVTERDEFVYHDMITHVAMFTHPNPKRVLVIGGGDGGTAREVIRHSSVEECYMVEIDPLVVEACKKHIPQTAGELENPKIQLKIEDGVKFVAETDLQFDVVIVDSTDPFGPATPLFGDEFYQNVKRILSDDGMVVSQAENPFYNAKEQKDLLDIVSRNFDRTYVYSYNNLTYPGGLWTFMMGTKGICPIGDFKPARVTDSDLKFQYYSADIHRASFVIPQFMKDNLQEKLSDFKKPIFGE